LCRGADRAEDAIDLLDAFVFGAAGPVVRLIVLGGVAGLFEAGFQENERLYLRPSFHENGAWCHGLWSHLLSQGTL